MYSDIKAVEKVDHVVKDDVPGTVLRLPRVITVENILHRLT
jgi:hypothetical protein